MKKKIVALTLVVVLALTATIGGTLAYFSDDDAQTNTFTVGKVGLDLTEVVKGLDGFEDVNVGYDDNGAQYKVMPGLQYAKQPHITMDADSEPAYVFVELTFSPADALWGILDNDRDMLEQLLVNYNADIFEGEHLEANLMGSKQDGNSYSEVYYVGIKEKNETFVLFDGVKIPENLEDQNLPTISFNIKASAIQAAGIDDENAAFEELYPNY